MKKNLLTMLLSLLIPLGALAQEAYAVLTADGTLTFYYDNQRSVREGTTYDLNTGRKRPDWYKDNDGITQVIFDDSFRDARPSTTYSWFNDCTKLTSLDLSNLNTSNVTDMSEMFEWCTGLSSLDLSNFNTSNVTDMSGMFWNCDGLTSLDLSNLNTSNVTDMNGMFCSCSGLTSLDLSSFDTSNVTQMSSMFAYCYGLVSLDLSNFDTRNVTDMSSMFGDCSQISSLNLSNFNTSNVTDMSGMFWNCDGLTSLDLSSFDTSNVTQMSSMFQYCYGLVSLDLSSFDTSNVTDMSSMFKSCNGLVSLDLSNFDTRNVTDMSSMFNYCFQISSLNLSNFNTGNVEDMESMFSGCRSLTSLDLSSFDTSNVTDMSSMFGGCFSLTTINCGLDWSTDKVTNSTDMFKDCVALVGGYGTAYDSNYIDKSYACIDLVPYYSGYLTLTLICDENSEDLPLALGMETCIKVKRTINADEWSTISLPFDMTEEQVKEAFGADVLLKEYVGYNVYLDNDKNVTGINLNFVDADLTNGFHLNHPYLIKVSKNIKSFLVTSTINASSWDDVYIEQYDEKREKNIYSVFWTNPVARVLDSGELFLSGNKFWYSTGLTRTKGLRANFRLDDVLMSTDDASARISMSFDDSESTTGIGSLTPTLSEDDGAYYDLSGRRVEKPVKGLYIRNNKKVFVK